MYWSYTISYHTNETLLSEPFRGLLSEAENLAKFMQYQMISTAEQDLILKQFGNNFDEVLVMKIVIENLNFTLAYKNETSEELLNLKESLENSVFTLLFA